MSERVGGAYADQPTPFIQLQNSKLNDFRSAPSGLDDRILQFQTLHEYCSFAYLQELISVDRAICVGASRLKLVQVPVGTHKFDAPLKLLYHYTSERLPCAWVWPLDFRRPWPSKPVTA